MQITQNNKFAISFQYPKEEMSDEVDFLHGDKHQSFLQAVSTFLTSFLKGDTIIMDEMIKHS